MKYTQEQLTEMLDYEINMLIEKERSNQKDYKAFDNIFGDFLKDLIKRGKVNYCKMGQYYIPIAIKNSISIDYLDGMVTAIITKPNWNREEYNANDFIASREMHPENTGRAVCEAFLMGVE